MTTYRDGKNEIVTLGRPVERGGRSVGQGGEGTVHEVPNRPEQVAKIWHSSGLVVPANGALAETGEKIKIMAQSRPALPVGVGGGLFVKPHNPFAWPEEVLYDSSGEKVVGFLMPKIDLGSFHEIFHYYIPEWRQEMERARNGPFRRQDFLSLARNLAEAVDRIHQAGYVIGDINDKNVLANDSGQIIIIDCDSMQVKDPHTGKTYLCRVMRPEYTRPGLRTTVERTTNDDCFGLAVLIFKLLMQGVHPYQISINKPKTKDKIRDGNFPYRDNTRIQKSVSQIRQQYQIDWQSMEPGLRRCFRDAFASDYKSSRPSAMEWATALDCVINPSHVNAGRAHNRQDIEELKRQLESARSTLGDKDTELEQMRQRLQDAQESAGDMLRKAGNDLADEKSKRENAESNLERTRNDLASKNTKLLQMKQQLHAANQELETTNSRLGDALGAKAIIDRNLEAEQKNHRKTHEQLQEENQKCRNLEHQLGTTRHDLNNTKRKLSSALRAGEISAQNLISERQEKKAEQKERKADRRRLFWMLPTLAGASAIVGAGITAILFLL